MMEKKIFIFKNCINNNHHIFFLIFEKTKQNNNFYYYLLVSMKNFVKINKLIETINEMVFYITLSIVLSIPTLYTGISSKIIASSYNDSVKHSQMQCFLFYFLHCI